MRKLALITGATSGIGLDLARIYAREGFDLALVGRREQRLECLSGELSRDFSIRAYSIIADLTAEGAVDLILGAVARKHRAVDVLVNCAGYSLDKQYHETSWDDQQALTRILYLAPIEMIKKTLPSMKKRASGRILNISSLAAFLPGSPNDTQYSSLKAALNIFTQNLAVELKLAGFPNVKVSAICPGYTYSEFHDVNGSREIVKNIPQYMWMTSEQVARSSYRANEQGQILYIPGMVNKLIYIGTKLLPQGLSQAMALKSYRALNAGTVK